MLRAHGRFYSSAVPASVVLPAKELARDMACRFKVEERNMG